MDINEPRHPDAAPASANVPQVPLRTIFWIFFQIGSLSFGGGLTAWLYREAVEKRRLVEQRDFLGGLTLAQVLPGINMTNMSVYVGQRLRGKTGAVTAVFGLISFPFFAVIAVAGIYSLIKAAPALQSFLDGMAAAAVGLLLSMAYRSVRATKMQRNQLLVMGLVVLAVGIMRWPMIPVILALGPVSVWLAWPRAEEPGDGSGAGGWGGHA